MVDEVDPGRERRREALQVRLRAAKQRERAMLVALVVALLLGIGAKIAYDVGKSGAPQAPSEAHTPPDLDADHEIPPPRRTRMVSSRTRRMEKLAQDEAAFELKEPDKALVWTDGGTRQIHVAEVQRSGTLVLRTVAGPLKVNQSTWRAFPDGPPEVLGTLVGHAQREGMSLVGATFTATGVEPPRLVGSGYLVVAGGVLRSQPAPDGDTAQKQRAQRQELVRAMGAFLATLDRAPIDEATRVATRKVLGSVAGNSGNFWSSLNPKVTRRLIRHGWLKRIGAPEAETRALEAAVAAATKPLPTRVSSGPGGTYIRYRDLFGRSTDVLSTADGVWYTCSQPKPQWLGSAPRRTVVVQLAAGSDPFAERVEPIGAQLRGFDAVWRPGGVLALDEERWHGLVRKKVGHGGNMPDNVFPPHALVTNGYGDAELLLTKYGAVRPARDASAAERKRFFDEAAAALPDVAHMDLIGEILYTYAWDTAEYDRPLLIGTEKFNGDIHQTADQTLETGDGGIYRGDCDDLACFYHALTRHQGRNAHVLSLPHHLANAYAYKDERGWWNVAILHTGPPFLIRDRSLGAAIQKTFAAFESHESVDLGGLPFSLRFGDDNVRQRYMLPAEIFRNAQYADALINVQAAYRFYTYRDGIETMKAILAKREKPTTADHRETAHLLTWALRDKDATPHFQKALAAADSPATRVDAGLDLLGNLIAAKQHEQATALAMELIRDIIPSLEARTGQLLQPWIRLAATLLSDEKHRAKGIEVLAGTAAKRVERSFSAVETLARRKGFNARSLHYNGLPRHTTNIRAYINTAMSALGETREDKTAAVVLHREQVDLLVQRWFANIAFRTLHTNSSVLGVYSSVSRYYEGHFGEKNVEKMVASEGAPTDADLRRANRPPTIKPTPDPYCLRMIHLSPGFRRGVWWRMFIAKPDEYDAKLARQAMYEELASMDRAEQAGLGHHSDPTNRLVVRAAIAMVGKNPQLLRPVLVEAAARRDHGLDDAIIRLLAAGAARHEPKAWRVLAEIWADEMGKAPDYFKLAWLTLRGEHPAHAQEAGRVALARHPDRQDFAHELEHLAQVAKQRASTR